MRRSRFQRGLGFLLVAIMLPGRTIPPGLCHAHADGDRPHRHDRPHHHAAAHAERHDGHSHDDADDAHRPGSPRHSHDHDECTVTEAVPHVHVNFFGVDITLPISDRDHRNNQEEQSHGLALVAVVSDSPAVVGQSPISWKNFSLAPSALSNAIYCAADEHNHWVKSSEACSIPLCDSARRERSGVLIV